MPAYLKEMGALACKVVTVYKNNPKEHNMPTTIGKVLLQDPATGDVICIMDGGYLTAVRTGAVSGVATRYLAKNERNMTVGIFGAGVQAKMQLWAMCEVRDVTRAFVYDLSDEAAEAFIAEMSEKHSIEVIRAQTPQEILDNCPIFCTATSSATPSSQGSVSNPEPISTASAATHPAHASSTPPPSFVPPSWVTLKRHVSAKRVIS